MHGTKNIAIRAVRSASSVILQNIDRLDTIEISEKHKHDYVSEIDIKAEQIIINTILKAFPDHSILSEEMGSINQNPNYTWIIDPIDGTSNFIHGLPHFAISIALKAHEQIVLGVIFDPIKNELFTASQGGGAQLNDKRVRIKPDIMNRGFLVGTGLIINDHQYVSTYLKLLKAYHERAISIRCSGSSTLDLAYVACGRLDGFWQCHLKSWDMAAASLLIVEAGGFVSDHQGSNNFLTTGQIVAGHHKVHKLLLDLIKAGEHQPNNPI